MSLTDIKNSSPLCKETTHLCKETNISVTYKRRRIESIYPLEGIYDPNPEPIFVGSWMFIRQLHNAVIKSDSLKFKSDNLSLVVLQRLHLNSLIKQENDRRGIESDGSDNESVIHHIYPLEPGGPQFTIGSKSYRYDPLGSPIFPPYFPS